jgi:hypothetical protein
MHFQSKPYVQNINLAPTCFSAAGTPSSGSPKDPDEIVRMLRHECQISEGREWIPSVLSAEGTECDWYSKYMVYFENAFHWSFFHHNLKNAWSKLQNGETYLYSDPLSFSDMYGLTSSFLLGAEILRFSPFLVLCRYMNYMCGSYIASLLTSQILSCSTLQDRTPILFSHVYLMTP